ncbi:cyclase family protein [candidate division KSB3 bacterium]|uniref:Cyclase family protein n=1 Tax=candidate division KSB3 bacterium TaxID=2044937 RepID=A0A9D5JWQ0_9BACT|nr:cyclase family protein [candidate division KSB3 bacterium]MBD3325682.1 cyclase family protein [candidate division KSB3 bacterium]
MNHLRYSRIIDLSHEITLTIPRWPGDPPVELETVATIPHDGYYLQKVSLGEHSATHMNAPKSFHQDGVGIEAYSAESRVVPAVVIDVRTQSAADPDYVLTTGDILAWEARYGQIPAGSVVIMYTGWQEKWQTPAAFLNQDESGGFHFPGFGKETTRFLLNHRHIAGVGIDTHGVDPGQETSYLTNTQVLAQQGIVLECLTHLDQLPPTGTTLVLGILRLRDGSGSPVSVMAFIP